MPSIRKMLSALALLPLATHALAAPAEFWYSHSGAAGSAIADLCRSFNSQREENDRLHCVSQGSYEQTLQKTVAAYRAGIGPALVEIYDVATPDMLLGGATRPVEAIMADHHRAYPDDTFLPALRRYYADDHGTLAAQPLRRPQPCSTRTEMRWPLPGSVRHPPRGKRLRMPCEP